MELERAATGAIHRPGPAVTIDDHTTAATIDRDRWRALAGAVLDALGVGQRCELAVTFVDVDKMAELNRLHMGEDGPTDVLSFPIDGDSVAGPDARPSAPRPPRPPDDSPPVLLGDIVICPGVAATNAPDHAGAFDDEIALLLVHGILHLLGHDHADDADRMAMQGRERELLASTYGPLARDPWAS